MRVEIDDKSGFCFGVVRAIDKAERALADYGTVYSLGDIVHNRIEVQRLTPIWTVWGAGGSSSALTANPLRPSHVPARRAWR